MLKLLTYAHLRVVSVCHLCVCALNILFESHNTALCSPLQAIVFLTEGLVILGKDRFSTHMLVQSISNNQLVGYCLSRKII